MTEPARLDTRLSDVREAWERQASARALALRDGEPIEADEIAEARRLGIAAARDASWHRLMPQRFHRAALADLRPSPATRAIGEWATDPGGRNLVLLGPVGVGKTHAAVAACRPAHDRGLSVRFAPVIELLDALRPSSPDEVSLGEIVDIDRLIIDDLGTQRDTDWTAERLDAVINRRWLEGRPTVVTTNLDPDTLADRLGERTYSRLVGGAVIARLSGEDRRRA